MAVGLASTPGPGLGNGGSPPIVGNLTGDPSAPQEYVTMFHGTSRGSAQRILNEGFRTKEVFFGDYQVADYFALGKDEPAKIGIKMTKQQFDDLGIFTGLIGEYNEMPWVDVGNGKVFVITDVGKLNKNLLAGEYEVRAMSQSWRTRMGRIFQ